MVGIAHARPLRTITYVRHAERHNKQAAPLGAGSGALRPGARIYAPGGHACRVGPLRRIKAQAVCDNTHRKIMFNANGEPTSGTDDLLQVRDGVLQIDH